MLNQSLFYKTLNEKDSGFTETKAVLSPGCTSQSPVEGYTSTDSRILTQRLFIHLACGRPQYFQSTPKVPDFPAFRGRFSSHRTITPPKSQGSPGLVTFFHMGVGDKEGAWAFLEGTSWLAHQVSLQGNHKHPHKQHL